MHKYAEKLCLAKVFFLGFGELIFFPANRKIISYSLEIKFVQNRLLKQDGYNRNFYAKNCKPKSGKDTPFFQKG